MENKNYEVNLIGNDEYNKKNQKQVININLKKVSPDIQQIESI